MIEIVPAIIAKSYEELESMVQKVEAYVSRVQIDVMDGKFVNNQTSSQPQDLEKLIPTLLNKELEFEIHLMVENPRESIQAWLQTPAQRYLIHLEANQTEFGEIIQIIKSYGRLIGPTLNPETPIEMVNEYIHDVDLIQLMGVNPGFYGREFIRYTVSRISHLHELYPELPIEVDGGITPDSARMCIDAGASILVSGSYIFNSPDIRRAIEELKQIDSSNSS